MIRITKALAVAAVVVLSLPSIASATGISIVGVSGAGAGGTLLPGETVTFDLVLDNDQSVYGLGVNVTGYDTPDLFGIYDGNLAFQSGQAVDAVFGLDVPTLGVVGSLNRVPGSAPEERFFVSQFDPQAYTTSLFVGADTSGHIGTGLEDIGLGGLPIALGDIHFQVTFVNVGAGSGNTANLTLQFGLDVIGQGGAILPATGDSFSLTVVPEPGTALLMGLGLAGLAARRR